MKQKILPKYIKYYPHEKKQKTLLQQLKHIKHHTYGRGRRFLPNGPKYTKANLQRGSRRFFPKISLVWKQKILPQQVLYTKSPQQGSRRFSLKILSEPYEKQKILPQQIIHLHYSLVSPFILLLSEFVISKQVLRGRRFLPMLFEIRNRCLIECLQDILVNRQFNYLYRLIILLISQILNGGCAFNCGNLNISFCFIQQNDKKIFSIIVPVVGFCIWGATINLTKLQQF